MRLGRQLRSAAAALTIGAVISLLVSSCSGDDQTASTPTDSAAVVVETRHDLADFGDPSTAPGYLPPIDPASGYVRSLCAIDFLAMMEAEGNASLLAEAVTALPAEDEVQQAERQRLIDMVDSIGEAEGLGDPVALATVVEIGDVLRTRCS